MFRLVFMTFHGEFRGGEEAEHHLHESPWTMTLPLQILGVLSMTSIDDVASAIGASGLQQSLHMMLSATETNQENSE